MKSILMITLLVNAMLATAQENQSGTVLDSEFKTPLPYVNIGIIDKDKGTVTDSEGKFNMAFPKGNYGDLVKISRIGYESQTFLVADFIERLQENSAIYLTQKMESLSEVVISNKKMKKRTLGNRAKSKLLVDGFDWDKLGSEAGIVVKIKKSPTYIKSFHVYIASNDHEELKFRLNFYTVKDDMPHENITPQNIIITSKIKEGLLSADLSSYNIVMEDDFFISLEWIENFGAGDLLFSMGLLGSPAIYRYTSQGVWYKIAMAGPGIHVDVEY